ncbi:MAG: carboxymethylenebutenolidase [Frankiaceae bacterium]|nr:carboxymethylenebutenolidase [Frankiaceae bacterium]
MPDLDYPVPAGTLRGYLAVPSGPDSGPGPWPGVVVVHEIFGLTDDIRAQADRFAERGYVALAPDLFAWGAAPKCLLATLKASASGHGRALDDVDAARDYLAARDDCTGNVGVAGFCLGGALAMLLAPKGFRVAAANYGHLPREPEQALAGACPVVGSYGGRDLQLRGAAAKLDGVLTGLGVEHDVKEYPDATHGFLFPHTGRAKWFEPWLVRYDPDAAADAWSRIFDYFDAHLKEAA